MKNQIKKINQIWFDFDNNSKMPSNSSYEIMYKKLQSLNPTYEYKLWTLKDALEFVDEFYPEFSNFMQKATPYNIVKCDFFRYLIMYHYGGIYLDLDFCALKSFDDFFDDLYNNKLETQNNNSTKEYEIILTEEWLNSSMTSNTLHNGFLISMHAKNPFWLKLLNDINKCSTIVHEKNDVFKYTGTNKLNIHYKENEEMCKGIVILPHYYMCPYMCVNKNDTNKVVLANANKTLPTLETHNWCFFTETHFDYMDQLCQDSYVACIMLSNGSSWR